MKRIFNAIAENEYVEETLDSIFTVLLRETTEQSQFHYLDKYSYIEGLLKYTDFTKTTDLFQYIRPKILKKIRKRRCFFVFDASTEGFSPIYDWLFFDCLYYSCEKYSIDPRQVIFVSANLRDDQNIKKYCRDNKKVPLRVFCFPSFEQVLAIDERQKDQEIEKFYDIAIEKAHTNYNGKILSSLSRTNRHYRSLSIFLTYHSKLRNISLLSHNTIDIRDKKRWLQSYGLAHWDEGSVDEWTRELPMTIDRKDFSTNWAIDTPYRHIHDQTVFQVVNETHQNNWNKTSMFFSEKTFRPVAYFQPFVIYGQAGCNRWLSKIGYHTYDPWFDLSFDDIEDPVKRCQTMIEMLEDTASMLLQMDREQQLNWRFKQPDLLKSNFKTMVESRYSRQKLQDFLKKIQYEKI